MSCIFVDFGIISRTSKHPNIFIGSLFNFSSFLYLFPELTLKGKDFYVPEKSQVFDMFYYQKKSSLKSIVFAKTKLLLFKD